MAHVTRFILACAVATSLLAGHPANAQTSNAPHVGYVYPAGGQQGTAVQVKIGGRFLDGATGLVVSGRGIRARVAGVDKPMNGQQIAQLREKLQQLQKQENSTALLQQVAEARARIGDSIRRNANPALAEIVTLDVVIDAEAAPGPRQLRLATPSGLSNLLVFCVGRLPEFREKDEKRTRADSELAITLPAVLNGRIIPGDIDRLQFPLRRPPDYMPGDVDRYRFHAAKGQSLVIAASARDLMPYLADAVPGWFQATLTLFDGTGREVAYDDDYGFQPDPVLHYDVPRDGDYVVEIRDALYRGREDFVYRITIGEVPFVTGVFPLGGRAGARASVAVSGWNLTSGTATIDGHGLVPGIHPVPIMSNIRPFAFDTLKELVEREPNDSTETAQSISPPVAVNGRIDHPGDRDVFSFKGRRGDRIVAEVLARRLGSPLDSVLELTDAAGRRLAFNDDNDDKAAGLETHHADSRLMATLPANGTYFIRLGDIQHHGGAGYAYRLRVGPPQPDFDLRIAPSTVNAAGNTAVPVTVRALRKDGFAGDIDLAVADAPGGVVLSGGRVPAGLDEVRMTVTVPPGVSGEPWTLRIEGRATINGRTVTHDAVPADDMMQAFAYHHLVPADALRVAVSGRGATRVPARILDSTPLKMPAGGDADVRVALPPGYRAFEQLRFDLSEPPDGITLRDSAADSRASLSAGPIGAQFTVHADAGKAAAGLRGNLIVTVSGERVIPDGQPGAGARRRMPLATLPAIPFEIVAPLPR